jgi:hypothetical protein
VLATHLLPDTDWTEEYHRPLEAAIDAWPDPDAATPEVLALSRTEIEVRRAHAGEFGYAAFVLWRRVSRDRRPGAGAGGTRPPGR